MWKHLVCIALYFVCLSPSCFSQEVAPSQDVVPSEERLTTAYWNIRDRLTDLKANSKIVIEQLQTLQLRLNVSQKEAEKWKEQSMTLSNSLTSINEELSNCYETIEKQQASIEHKGRLINICLLILGIKLLLTITGVILNLRGIVTPKWLDILV